MRRPLLAGPHSGVPREFFLLVESAASTNAGGSQYADKKYRYLERQTEAMYLPCEHVVTRGVPNWQRLKTAAHFG